MLPSNTTANDHGNACPQVIFSNTSEDKVPPLPQRDKSDYDSASSPLWLQAVILGWRYLSCMDFDINPFLWL